MSATSQIASKLCAAHSHPIQRRFNQYGSPVLMIGSPFISNPFDVLTRYATLKKTARAFEFPDEADWLRQRVKVLSAE